jgi:tyrosyl-tRNA synthetase
MDIVTSFYGSTEAENAQNAFVRTFQKHEAPEEMDVYKLQSGQTVLDVLIGAELVSSKGEARRLIEQKGVRLDGEVLTDSTAKFPHPGVLQVGKRRFVKVQ